VVGVQVTDDVPEIRPAVIFLFGTIIDADDKSTNVEFIDVEPTESSYYSCRRFSPGPQCLSKKIASPVLAWTIASTNGPRSSVYES
jgi:hypothetical protein